MSKKHKFCSNAMEKYWDSLAMESQSGSEEVRASSDESTSLFTKFSPSFCDPNLSSDEAGFEDDFLVSRASLREDVWKSATEADPNEYGGTDLFRELYVSTKAKKSSLKIDLADTAEFEEKIKQKHSDKATFATVLSKAKEEQMNLQQLENAMLAKISLVRHDGGIYYYNGKTYVALKNDMEVLELIRSHGISENAFNCRSLKIFQDLHTFLKTNPRLIPYDYEERLRKSKNHIVLNNGVLNAKKLELKDFHPKHLTFHSVNASWKEYPNPKRFLKFLNDAAMNDPQIVRLTLEVMGCLLSSLNLKKFFVIGTAGMSRVTWFTICEGTWFTTCRSEMYNFIRPIILERRRSRSGKIIGRRRDFADRLQSNMPS